MKGVAIECRINAENVEDGFRPCPGKIVNFRAPGGLGVRLDSHVYSGYTVPPNYDSMIAKLIVYKETREEAISCMKRCLDEFTIEGVATTLPFRRRLLSDAGFVAGQFDTEYVAASAPARSSIRSSHGPGGRARRVGAHGGVREAAGVAAGARERPRARDALLHRGEARLPRLAPAPAPRSRLWPRRILGRRRCGS